MTDHPTFAAVEPDLLPLLAERLRALADPLRLRLMQELSHGECTVGELVERVGTTQPNVSRHLERLVQAGWVERRRDGSRVWLRIADRVVGELCGQVCGLVRRQVARDAAAVGLGSQEKEAS